MNYIHKLQNRVEVLEQEKARALEDIIDLQRYLLSRKFDDDPTVQVADVLRRLAPIKLEVLP